MLDTCQRLLANQYEAALCTLNTCLERCPDSAWNARAGNHPFCRVVFHTLFFADYYLGQNEESLRGQPFHRHHAEFFGDYEELEYREPVRLYDRADIRTYMQHCRNKARQVVAAETAATLSARAGFEGREFSRAELHVYNIRHIQHHAAQLSPRLRLDFAEDIPWVGSGWREKA